MWLRYVDDTFVIINRNDLEHFHRIINSMNNSIKFSGEEEQNNFLRYRDGKINTSVYRKSSNCDIVLHYGSNHPPGHKRLCVKTLFDRAQLYCSDGKTLALEYSYLFNMFRSFY